MTNRIEIKSNCIPVEDLPKVESFFNDLMFTNFSVIIKGDTMILDGV